MDGKLRWGEVVLIGGWLLLWLLALSWAQVIAPAGLLIPVLAAAAIPRIFRQLHPAPRRFRAPSPGRRWLGRLVLVVGLVAAAGTLALAARPIPELRPMSRIEAAQRVADWRARHPDAGVEAAEAHSRQVAAERLRQGERQAALRPLGVLGGAGLSVVGIGLLSGSPVRRRRRCYKQGDAQANPDDDRRRVAGGVRGEPGARAAADGGGGELGHDPGRRPGVLQRRLALGREPPS